MKKIVLSLMFILMIVSGCGSETKLDLKKIEKNLVESSYFQNHNVLDVDTINKKYSLDVSEDVLMISSKKYDDASMILIVKDKKDQLEKFIDSYNDQWVKMNYFPDEKKLVEDAVYTNIGKYYIYIVSESADEVLKIVKK